MTSKRINILVLISLLIIAAGCATPENKERKVFDVHLHGDALPEKQLDILMAHGVRAIAVSTSWSLQRTYQSHDSLEVLHGLFVPCPGGKVPYSLQTCFDEGNEWPDLDWVERQIKEGSIDFIGEVLAQYHGISPSDTLLLPYYALAQKYDIPVGIHTGSAGPDHGCINFKEEMGNPILLQDALAQFPELKVWFMHGGVPFLKECLMMMKTYPRLYADISVLNNPDIVPPEDFHVIMKSFIEEGLEDRILFGSDNGRIERCIESIEQLNFLSAQQKEKIFYLNAEAFFGKKD